jgi:hypothetical protein
MRALGPLAAGVVSGDAGGALPGVLVWRAT